MEGKTLFSKMNFAKEIGILKEVLSKHEINVPIKNHGFGLALEDPNARRIIGSHYALSHYTAGLIMLSNTTDDFRFLQSAELCLKYIESNHHKNLLEIDYHHDFNNFVWSILLLIEKDRPGFLPPKFELCFSALLMDTPDSKHDTMNWLSMRAVNNLVRYQISSSKPYLKKATSLLSKLSKAQYRDGMYDDLLPKGLSGNIQYHVYTTAIILLIRHFGIGNGGGNVNDALNFTISAIDPEGDFNYFGRGTNQLFGWGPFLFNLNVAEIDNAVYEKCKGFFCDNLNLCLKRNGLLLKNNSIDQYNYWWDYHYSSVYSAHLFFWLNLLNVVTPQKRKTKKQLHNSSLLTVSTEKSFCSVFKGRSLYICENGPQITNIWTKSHGSLFKGPLGPFFGQFGNNHISKSLVVMNYFGPIVEYPSSKLQRIASPTISKLLLRVIKLLKFQVNYGLVVEPLFPMTLEFNITDDNIIEIVYRLSKSSLPIHFNFPFLSTSCLNNLKKIITVKFDDNFVDIFHISSAYGPYGKFELYRTHTKTDLRIIRVRISQV